MHECRDAGRVGQVLLDDVHHAAKRIGPVQHARGAAYHFDSLGIRGLDVGTVLVAPLLRLEPLAVVEHEHAVRREPANDGLPNTDAGAPAVYARHALERFAEAWR